MTPAMRRATDAVFETGGSINSEHAAYAAVAAALDVEEMARAIQAAERARGETLREWADVPERARESYRDDARAIIRAALLGGDQ